LSIFAIIQGTAFSSNDGIVTVEDEHKIYNNINKNNNICLAFFEGEKGWRINGKAEYHTSGKWLDFVKSLKENNEVLYGKSPF